MKSNWDQEVPKDAIKAWSALAEELPSLSDITFLHEAVNTEEPLKLYIFCDFVIYAVQGEKSGILFTKGKVAPLKPKSYGIIGSFHCHESIVHNFKNIFRCYN